ncbi:MOSC N-terminal beta barrel domain-containing protein [Exophiala viscosa]|uniref:MOSC N-terminal beta barrel domain-containing protein n=1 Tax=Exophiala viscosa TaxID=2486360 RepID=A0AAN6DUL2_9EURO|nr:MOSC N-terminal beta barrel domain-containing protein [Exophiala viscosa]KAI1623503.1 MOSC N-terminal beta barrel domain-containing protein [Exophiala viscosa]
MTHTVSEITDLRVYPIKSCRGISVKSAQLTRQGLELDRRWMFIDSKHKFVTIRSKPQMTLINTAIDYESDSLVVTIGHDPDKQVRVPIHPDQAWLDANTKEVTVDIWEYITDGYAYNDPKIKSLFSDFFGEEVGFVMKGPEPRICSGNGDPKVLGRQETVNFPDVLPIQIASESSLAELNSRLKEKGESPITIERFRPNIIIKGGEPWSEDSWKTVRINGDSSLFTTLTGGNRGAIDIDVVARCARCTVPNVNPDTAEKNAHQPWDLLVSYRRVDEGIKFKPCFGMLCCPRNEGHVEIGMRFEVMDETQDHIYIKGF